MKTWLLIIVLTIAIDVEQHVAIIVPDEETCEAMREMFVYAVNIVEGEYLDPFRDEAFVPFLDAGKVYADDVRTPIPVNEVRCKEVVDE